MCPTSLDDQHALADSETTGLLAGASTLEAWLWLAVAGTLVLDIATTAYGLSVGFVEQNPVVRWALNTFGLAALPAFKLCAVAVALVCRRLCPVHAAVVPLGLALPWALAVGINLVVITSV